MANKVQTPSHVGTLILDGEMPLYTAPDGSFVPDTLSTASVESIEITSTPVVFPINQITGAVGEKFVVNARLAYLPEFTGAMSAPHLYPTSETFVGSGINSHTFTFGFTPQRIQAYFTDSDDVVYGPPPMSGYGFAADQVAVVAVGQNQITVSWNVHAPAGRRITYLVYSPGT